MLNVSPWNLICIILNLLILAALMKKFLYKPVLGIIEKRDQMIKEQMAQAENSKAEALHLKKQYETSLSDLKAEREQVIKDAKAQAGAEYNKILADADEKAQKILADVQTASQAEQEKVLRSADAQIAKLAAEAAAKIVGQHKGQDLDTQIYEDFLRKAGE